MASAMFGDYKIGGISEALGTVKPKDTESEENSNKLQSLFEEGEKNLAIVSEDGSGEGKHVQTRPIFASQERKRGFDGTPSGENSRKKQRENRNKKKLKKNISKLEEAETSADQDSGDKSSKTVENESNKLPKLDEEKKDLEDPERLERTIFVGNVSVDSTRKDLKVLFSKYGGIESVRLRSVPVANAKHSKKVSVIKKEFHPDRQTMNAYVVFKDKDSVKNSLIENGCEFKDKHLRVNPAGKHEPKNKMCVFVGNLPFSIQEEEIWKHFSFCGEVADVRVVRDQATGMGKGFAYVTFKKQESVTFALKMKNSELMERRLRVFPAVSKDAVKKPFNKKKDREYRMKDMSSKVAKKGKGGLNQNQKKLGKSSFKGKSDKRSGKKDTSKSKGLHAKSSFSRKVAKKKHSK